MGAVDSFVPCPLKLSVGTGEARRVSSSGLNCSSVRPPFIFRPGGGSGSRVSSSANASAHIRDGMTIVDDTKKTESIKPRAFIIYHLSDLPGCNGRFEIMLRNWAELHVNIRSSRGCLITLEEDERIVAYFTTGRFVT
jgi:hypothetical protein